jgi:predicted adenine nucleotide alpha hydrolase (AANH) superfamily ATPase
MSVSDGITMFDLTFWYVTREWFYTALTRATSLDRIFFWEPEVKLHSLQAVQESEVRAAMERRIAGHKLADAKAGRPFAEEDYVTVERVLELVREQGARCFACQTFVVPPRAEGDGKAKGVEGATLSLDRINNDFPHTSDNVRIACLLCCRGLS